MGFEGLVEAGKRGLSGVDGGGGEAGPVEEFDFLGVGTRECEGTEALLGLVC